MHNAFAYYTFHILVFFEPLTEFPPHFMPIKFPLPYLRAHK